MPAGPVPVPPETNSAGALSAPAAAAPDASGFPAELPADPLPLLAAWMAEAKRDRAAPNPDAMVLATATRDGRPSARVVLCKGLDVERGHLVFYTNYESRKGRELDENPCAAAVFHWDHAARQARVEGRVARSPAEESDAYFATRPLLSQLGAWASQQSRPLDSRFRLLDRVGVAMAKFGIGTGEDLSRSRARVPRPEHWGGYRLSIERVELWVGGDFRLHERAVWERRAEGGAGGGWSAWRPQRVQP